jgi:hypothetical protein
MNDFAKSNRKKNMLYHLARDHEIYGSAKTPTWYTIQDSQEKAVLTFKQAQIEFSKPTVPIELRSMPYMFRMTLRLLPPSYMP